MSATMAMVRLFKIVCVTCVCVCVWIFTISKKIENPRESGGE